MKSNIIKKLTDNLGIKILAVICATILWLIVYNIDDPNKTKLFTTNVVVKNASVLENITKTTAEKQAVVFCLIGRFPSSRAPCRAACP